MMRLAVVFVHFEDGRGCTRAIESFREQACEAGIFGDRLEVVVVDNGSSEEDRIRLAATAATVIRSERNLGYAGGANLGVAKTSAEHVIVANTDLFLGPGALAALLERLRAGADIVGPRFVWDEAGDWWLPPLEPRGLRHELLDFAARRSAEAALRRRMGYRAHCRRHWLSVGPIATAHLSGALLAFTRDAARRFGPLDATYPLYFEDDALMLAADRAGARIEYVPGAIVHHQFAQPRGLSAQAARWFVEGHRHYREARHGPRLAQILETLDARLPGRGPSSTLELGPPRLEAPEGTMLVELGFGASGVPAVAARATPGQIEFPTTCWAAAPPGPYQFCALDSAGRELTRKWFEKKAPTIKTSKPVVPRRSRLGAALVRYVTSANAERVPAAVQKLAETTMDLSSVEAGALGSRQLLITHDLLVDAARIRKAVASTTRLVVPCALDGSETSVVRAATRTLLEAGFVLESEDDSVLEGHPYRLLVARPVEGRVREARADDEATLLAMFRVAFGSSRSPEHHRWKYVDNPFGRSRMSVAVDASDRPIASYSGYPVPLSVPVPGGRERRCAFQTGDTMSVERKVGRVPAIERAAHHYFAVPPELEPVVWFGFNRGNVQRFARRSLAGQFLGDAPARRLHLPSFRRDISSRVRRLEAPEAGLDSFFQRVAPSYGVLVDRSADYVAWRYFACPEPGFCMLALDGPSGFDGWAVFRRRGEVLVLGDLLIAEEATDGLRALLSAALARPEHEGVTQMETWLPARPRFLDHAVRALGFIRERERYDLGLITIGPLARAELVEKLYLTLSDTDLF